MLKSFLIGFLRGLGFVALIGLVVVALFLIVISFLKSIFLGIVIVGLIFGVLNMLDDIGLI